MRWRQANEVRSPVADHHHHNHHMLPLILSTWYAPPIPLFVIRNLMYNKPLVRKESYSLWSAASLNFFLSFKEPLLQLLKENDLFLKKETQPQTVNEYLFKEI